MDKNKYIIGIDGGGTKTHAILIDSRGNIKAEKKSSGTCCLILSKNISHTSLFLLMVFITNAKLFPMYFLKKESTK